MDGAAERRGGAGDDMHVVQFALQRLHGLQRLVLSQALGVALVGGDTQADDEVLAGGLAHGGEHFAEEAQARVEVAVVAVLAAVHPRIEELRWQVAVTGDHLHAVQPGGLQAARGGGVTGDNLVDHRLVQCARHDVEALVRRGGCGISHRQQAVGGFHDLAAGVEDLRQHHRALGMAGLGDPAVALDAGVVGGHQHVRGVARAVVHPGDLHDDQADTAFRPRLVVGDQLLVDQVVGGHRGVVAGGHDPVLQALAADFQRAEQVREGCHRGTLRFLLWVGPDQALRACQSTG
ncbi:hypothetical protein D3C78_1092110 [compost metagenome]